MLDGPLNKINWEGEAHLYNGIKMRKKRDERRRGGGWGGGGGGKKLEKRKEGEGEAGEERERKRGMGNPKTNRTKKFLSLTRCIRRF